MIARWNDLIEQWARDRGLEYVPDGLLPAWSTALAAGLGAGTHRAGLVTHRNAHSSQAVGGLKKWPERGSHHLCRGRLPGGLEGAVAHHVHLALDSFGDDGQSWYAFPDTVVLARLVEGSRVVTHLRARPGGPAEIKALFTFGGGNDNDAAALPVAGP